MRVYNAAVLSVCLCACSFSSRGGFVALSPISPQEMFLQPLSRSREEKEEEEDDEYHSPYHPYHRPHHHHHHLHTLVTSYMLRQERKSLLRVNCGSTKPISSQLCIEKPCEKLQFFFLVFFLQENDKIIIFK